MCWRRALARGALVSVSKWATPDGPVEAASAGGPVGRAKPGHASGIPQAPPLAVALHSGLQDMPMRALDCTAPDGQAVLPYFIRLALVR